MVFVVFRLRALRMYPSSQWLLLQQLQFFLSYKKSYTRNFGWKIASETSQCCNRLLSSQRFWVPLDQSNLRTETNTCKQTTNKGIQQAIKYLLHRENRKYYNRLALIFALAALPVTFDEKLLNLPLLINPQDFLLVISEILFHKNLQFQRYSHDLNFTAIRKRKGCVLSNSKREVVLWWMKARTVALPPRAPAKKGDWLRSRRTSSYSSPHQTWPVITASLRVC